MQFEDYSFPGVELDYKGREIGNLVGVIAFEQMVSGLTMEQIPTQTDYSQDYEIRPIQNGSTQRALYDNSVISINRLILGIINQTLTKQQACSWLAILNDISEGYRSITDRGDIMRNPVKVERQRLNYILLALRDSILDGLSPDMDYAQNRIGYQRSQLLQIFNANSIFISNRKEVVVRNAKIDSRVHLMKDDYANWLADLNIYHVFRSLGVSKLRKFVRIIIGYNGLNTGLQDVERSYLNYKPSTEFMPHEAILLIDEGSRSYQGKEFKNPPNNEWCRSIMLSLLAKLNRMTRRG